jgi:ABC-type uncharacterized transport system permease subunit
VVRGRRALRWLADWGPALPFLLLTSTLLVGSGLWLVRSSFSGPDGGWTVQPWRDVFGNPVTRDAIVRSVQVSAVVATLCVLVGTPLAWYVANLTGWGRSLSQALSNALSNFGGASLAIAMVTAFGAVGFVRLSAMDLLGVDLPFTLYSFWGLVVTYLYFCIPLYVLLLLPAMGALRPEWWEAVQVSSGTRWTYWRRVGLPVLSPFVVSGWVLLFAWAIGQFSVPFALLGEVPEVQLMTLRLGNFLFSATGGTNRFNRAAALAVLLMVFAAVALAIYRAVSVRMLRRLEGLA